MLENFKYSFQLLKKAINKSSIKEDELDPNYNLAWIVTPIGIALSVCGILIKYNWLLVDAILISIVILISIFLLYIAFFTFVAYKISQNKKVKELERIQQLESQINELNQKIVTQSDVLEKLRSEEGYGLAIRELYIAFSILNQYFFDKRNGSEKTKSDTEREIKDILKSFCNCLSKLYTKKHGSRCSVSLKLIDEDFEKLRLESILVNFERDIGSTDRDQDKNYSGHEHKVSNNTCFFEIVNAYINKEEENLFYTNPSLSSDVKYKTSSLDCRIKHLSRKEKKKITEGLKKPLERSKIWSNFISYKSEIIVPILLANSPFENTLLGFLCVDCEAENVFAEEFDVPLLKGVADGVYELITDFKSLK